MAVWYELEKSNAGIKNFLDSNWGFHDFRLERIEYILGKDLVEIFLKYDTGTEGVLLRFIGVQDIHIIIPTDYEVGWIMGSLALYLENDSILWLDDDNWDIHDQGQLDEAKKYTTWVEAKMVLWAITDGDGRPVEMPPERIDQVWNVWGTMVEKHFDLKAFNGDLDTILKRSL